MRYDKVIVIGTPLLRTLAHDYGHQMTVPRVSAITTVE